MSRNLLSTAALLAATIPYAMASSEASQSYPLSGNGKQLLQDVQFWAQKIKSDAAEVQFGANDPQADRELQHQRLSALALDVNSASKYMQALEAESASLPPWQQRAIAETKPLLKDIGLRAQEAIDFAKDQPLHLWAPENKAIVTDAFRDADKMLRELNEQLRLAKLREKEIGIEHDLGIAAGN